MNSVNLLSKNNWGRVGACVNMLFMYKVNYFYILFSARFKLAMKFREKFCHSPGIFGRSFYMNFRFAYTFYTFSLLPQLKIGKSLFICGDYFSLVAL